MSLTKEAANAKIDQLKAVTGDSVNWRLTTVEFEGGRSDSSIVGNTEALGLTKKEMVQVADVIGDDLTLIISRSGKTARLLIS